jgi:hypothetical protein
MMEKRAGMALLLYLLLIAPSGVRADDMGCVSTTFTL